MFAPIASRVSLPNVLKWRSIHPLMAFIDSWNAGSGWVCIKRSANGSPPISQRRNSLASALSLI
jgi:hypothetical protein